jgi:transcriptional regulator with XRE-family HTH domain
MAGLTVAAFARIERGHANPTWTTVRRIAAALDVILARLAEAVERNQPESIHLEGEPEAVQRLQLAQRRSPAIADGGPARWFAGGSRRPC